MDLLQKVMAVEGDGTYDGKKACARKELSIGL